MIIYYEILDLKKIGKRYIGTQVSNDKLNHQIYENGQWVDDWDGIILDRLLGVDSSEPDDSPYKIGNSDMINSIREIDEKEVPGLILKYY